MSAPATEQRCEITELLTDQCACRRCRNIPDPSPRLLGHPLAKPFAAVYPGECSDCGDRFEVGDRIRRDGSGGYVAQCCAGEQP